ncbi:MAG: oligoendopeptidase F [Proteobacteria bacterium]|nr:oligoendopeptidase F [Pseudomonadota bacterium]
MTSLEAAKGGPPSRKREAIDARYRWDLSAIFSDWSAWETGCSALEAQLGEYGGLSGTLSQGPAALLQALELADSIGQLAYRVWYYPGLMFDQDQRENAIDARRQRAQWLLARSSEASAWFNPELLTIPRATLEGWLTEQAPLQRYRFALFEVYRQQEHVLDQAGEQLLALGTQLASAPDEAYAALATADMRFPTLRLSTGEEAVITPGRYRALLAQSRDQGDRAAAFRAHYGCYEPQLNTYAALYRGVLERDWFQARARRHRSTLHAALHGNDIPPAVVENLIATTRAHVAPLQRYHRLRRATLGLPRYFLYDGAVALVADEGVYRYDEAVEQIIDSVAPLGAAYCSRMREAFSGGWIDVYENEGKRAGAYSAPVYGVHPYMLLNYNDTLDDVFTLAHEMGHALHTLLAHEHQPFVYSSYTIFIAEVASTLNEGLLLQHLLRTRSTPSERVVLLQRAIDGICGTFYTQVLFADFELQAHQRLERGEALTAEVLNASYRELLQHYYGDAIDHDERYALTWARIPHLYRSPYYVYQYATCFASSAQLLTALLPAAGEDAPQGAAERYLNLLRAGGSDQPMLLLRRAGVDLAEADAVQAVPRRLDALIDLLEQELRQLAAA